MKILVISPFLPYPEKSGSRIRTMTLLRALASHDVYLVAFKEEDETIPRDILKGLSRKYYVFPRPRLSSFQSALNILSLRPLLARRFKHKDVRQTIRRLVEDEGIGVVVCEAVLVAEYARSLRWVYRILDAHNLEFMRARGRIRMSRAPFKKLKFWLISARMKRYEKRALRDFELCIVCSEADCRALEEVAPKMRAVVIPNSVDTDTFTPGAAEAPPKIIFTGTLWYEPNLDAARWLAEDIFPLVRQDFPEMELLIVGDHPPDEVLNLTGGPGTSVVGPVEDIRPYLRQAMIFVAPVRTGSGTRQKILDAMAMGLPVVSTWVGAEGLDVADGKNICLAGTPEEFREKIRRLVNDREFRVRVARGGRKLVEEKYSRRAAVARLGALFRGVEAKVRKRG